MNAHTEFDAFVEILLNFDEVNPGFKERVDEPRRTIGYLGVRHLKRLAVYPQPLGAERTLAESFLPGTTAYATGTSPALRFSVLSGLFASMADHYKGNVFPIS